MDLTFSPLTAEQWSTLEELFGRAGASNGCWCMYWRIGPRYRDRPREDNKRDLELLARSGPPPGLLAFDGAAATLERAGATLVDVALPAFDEATLRWVPLCGLEAALAHEATFPSRRAEYGPD